MPKSLHCLAETCVRWNSSPLAFLLSALIGCVGPIAQELHHERELCEQMMQQNLTQLRSKVGWFARVHQRMKRSRSKSCEQLVGSSNLASQQLA
jgi:hypothetical protein